MVFLSNSNERLHDPQAIGLHIKAGSATADAQREREKGRKDSASTNGRHPYAEGRQFLRSFEIVSTHATCKEATAEMSRRNAHPNTVKLYTIGKVSLKGE